MSRTFLRFVLDPGERQLWAGAPRRGLVLRGSDAFLIPFSLLWAGFAVFWEVSAIRQGAGGFFVLWGVPFVLAGLYITVGRFFVDAARRARTAYAVTTERVLIERAPLGPFGGSSQSLPLRTLPEVTLRERRDGSGTLVFGTALGTGAFLAGASWPGVPQVPAFDLIPDARHVYDLIRKTQRETSRAG